MLEISNAPPFSFNSPQNKIISTKDDEVWAQTSATQVCRQVCICSL